MNKKFKKYNFCYTKQIKRIELSKKDYLIKVKYIKYHFNPKIPSLHPSSSNFFAFSSREPWLWLSLLCCDCSC